CGRRASSSCWPGCTPATASRGRSGTGGSPMKSDEATVIDRGRGPEIRGTRITVFDVLDYLLEGWHPHRIAAFFRIGSRQVEAAVEYIREHRLEVLREYVKILERCERGNPPELRAKLDANHLRFKEFLAKTRQVPEQDPEALRVRIGELIAEYRQGKETP